MRRNVIVSCLFLAMIGCSRGTTYEDAQVAARAGNYQTAVELFSELAKESDSPTIYLERGNCYSRLGNIDAGLADYQKAIDLIKSHSPSDEDSIRQYVYYNRAIAYERSKQFQLAVADYETAIELQSDYPGVKNNLAWLLATCVDESIRDPQRALKLAADVAWEAPDDPKAMDTVAACYASAGNFEQAIAAQEKAISLCSDPAALKRYNSRLEMYRDQEPFIFDQ